MDVPSKQDVAKKVEISEMELRQVEARLARRLNLPVEDMREYGRTLMAYVIALVMMSVVES